MNTEKTDVCFWPKADIEHLLTTLI
jgi:hypothetical protein